MKHPIPEAAFQQHVAMLGKTGSGKTFAAKGVVEGWLGAGKRVGIVDPTGAWWGLRSSKDGKSPGFPILVLGGDHGDVPLPAQSGAAVARLLVDQGVNLIADTSQLTVGESARWFIDFASTLYRGNRSPLQLVIDEAHNFAPQGKVPDPDTGKMLHAANRLASGGRSRGIRLLMITQRPQKLHKDALTSADTLIAMRLLAPHDRDAVRDWIRGAADDALGKTVLDSLASLPRGEGWVWYPEGGYLERVKFPAITTFDSSATPVDGEQLAAPKRAADIDLTEIHAALEEAMREAFDNDPKRLRKELERVQAELAKKAPTAKAAPDPVALESEYLRGFEEGREAGRDEASATYAKVITMLDDAADVLRGFETVAAEAASCPLGFPAKMDTVPKAPASTGERGAHRRVLTALVQSLPHAISGRKLSILADVKRGGSTWRRIMAELRKTRQVADDGEHFTATEVGVAALGSYDPLPTGARLRDHWRERMTAQSLIETFDKIIEAYPQDIDEAVIAESVGVELGGSTWRRNMARLRGLELITSERGRSRANDELFK